MAWEELLRLLIGNLQFKVERMAFNGDERVTTELARLADCPSSTGWEKKLSPYAQVSAGSLYPENFVPRDIILSVLTTNAL